MDEQELRDALEESIDDNSLQFWLYELADICAEKAAHIEASYGTGGKIHPVAFKWDKAANAIARLAESKTIDELSYSV